VRIRERWFPGRPTRVQVLILLAAAVLAVVGAVGLTLMIGGPGSTPGALTSPAASDATPRSGLPTVAVADLPTGARETLALIDRGGPYPYRQDNTVFANQEGLLPARPRGYYREYTVVTPGSADRGMRRLVLGADGDVYYTSDHYTSFRQVLR
jgi:ribonuclease T1